LSSRWRRLLHAGARHAGRARGVRARAGRGVSRGEGGAQEGGRAAALHLHIRAEPLLLFLLVLFFLLLVLLLVLLFLFVLLLLIILLLLILLLRLLRRQGLTPKQEAEVPVNVWRAVRHPPAGGAGEYKQALPADIHHEESAQNAGRCGVAVRVRTSP
jgi:Flp pilus assembly protein TadB